MANHLNQDVYASELFTHDKDFAEILEIFLAKEERNPAWLARKLGVERSTVTRWLNRDTPFPKNANTVEKIAEILNLNNAEKILLFDISNQYELVSAVRKNNLSGRKENQEQKNLPQISNGPLNIYVDPTDKDAQTSAKEWAKDFLRHGIDVKVYFVRVLILVLLALAFAFGTRTIQYLRSLLINDPAPRPVPIILPTPGPLSAEDFNVRGVRYAEQGQQELAIIDFSKAIELSPDYSIAYANRGNAYMDLDDFEAALTNLSKAIELDSENALAFANRGLLFINTDQLDAAQSDLNQAVSLNSEIDSAYFGLGMVAYKRQEYEDAISNFDKAIELNSRDGRYFEQRAFARIPLQQYDLIVSDASNAITFGVDSGSIYEARGWAHGFLGNIDLAVTDLSAALARESDKASTYNTRGIAYNALEKPDLAIKDFSKAIEIDPDYPHPYSNRANTYSVQGKYDLSLADIQKLQQLSPSDSSVFHALGLLDLAQERFDTAIENFTKAIEMDGNNASTFRNRGIAYFKIGEYNLMIADLENAVSIRADKAHLQFYTCHLGALTGYAGEVLPYCDQSLSLSEEEKSEYLQARGIARAITGNYVGAIEDFERFIATQPIEAQDQLMQKDWVSELENGRNPFNETMLEDLRNAVPAIDVDINYLSSDQETENETK